MNKGLILNNDKPTTYKEVIMDPDSVKMPKSHEIQDNIYKQAWSLVNLLKEQMLFESKWIYKINRLGYNILEEARLVKRLFTTKFKELTAIRLDLQQRCL